jgi:penicillin-binding protein A
VASGGTSARWFPSCAIGTVRITLRSGHFSIAPATSASRLTRRCRPGSPASWPTTPRDRGAAAGGGGGSGPAATAARPPWSLAARSGSGRAAAVVLDPDTGDVLALASYPFPGASRAHGDEADAAAGDLLDRARYGLYPPGSTFKLVTAAAALRGDPSLNRSTFTCSLQPNGRVGARIPGWGVVRDDVLDTHAHGTIGMHDGLVRSCNAFFAQLAVRLGPEPILDAAALLGISVSRDGSAAGLRDTLPQAGYGQGEVLATPLRMARVAAAIAGGGVLRDARLDPSASSPTATFLSADAAALLARYLRDAVLSGTARTLRAHPWRLAGKTGTAEISGARSHAWFVGFAPYGAAERRVAVAVIVENAGYGGVAAAPAAGEIVTAAAERGLVR